MAESLYWHEPTMRIDGAMPSILAIGDSWFWYPLPGGSLATCLARLVAAKQHTVLAFGNNGAEPEMKNRIFPPKVFRSLVNTNRSAMAPWRASSPLGSLPA